MHLQLLFAALVAGRVAALATNSPLPILARDDPPGTITAHPDGQCSKELSNGAQAKFQFKTGFPAFDTYKAQDFPGAETPDNGGGFLVFWKFPQPAPGCRNILMVPYNQPTHDESQATPGGIELVNTDRAGCFTTTLRVDEDVLLTFCCGDGDCGSASLGSNALRASPIEDKAASSNSTTEKPTAAPSAPPSISKRGAELPAVGNVGSPAARAGLQNRWFYPAPPEHKNCSFAPGSPFSRLGRQTVVSGFQFCDIGQCPFQVQHQTSMGTSLTSSTDQTITNSIGESVSVEAGVDFLVDGKTSLTISTDYSQSVTQTTGKDISQGNSTTVSLQMNLQAGNNAAVTFTPLFQCWTGAWDCGHGVNNGIDVCQPSLQSDGVTQDGFYRVVTSP